MFCQTRAALFGRRQEEDGFLDIRRQQEKIEDLGDASAGDTEETGEFGVVFDDAGTDLVFEVVRQGQEARYAGYCWRGWHFLCLVHPDTHEPVGGLPLRIRAWGEGWHFMRYTTTDGQGKFRAPALFPGTYRIDANRLALRYPVLGRVTIVAGQESKVQLEFDAALPPRWAPRLAVGPPAKTEGTCGWTPLKRVTGEEWLELDYRPALRANAVRVHEVWAPGAVTAVVLKDGEGGVIAQVPVVDSTDTVPKFLEVTFPLTDESVSSVRVVFDSARVKTLFSVDAVELVGPDGRGWAVEARASSALADLKVWLARKRVEDHDDGD